MWGCPRGGPSPPLPALLEISERIVISRRRSEIASSELLRSLRSSLSATRSPRSVADSATQNSPLPSGQRSEKALNSTRSLDGMTRKSLGRPRRSAWARSLRLEASRAWPTLLSQPLLAALPPLFITRLTPSGVELEERDEPSEQLSTSGVSSRGGQALIAGGGGAGAGAGGTTGFLNKPIATAPISRDVPFACR